MRLRHSLVAACLAASGLAHSALFDFEGEAYTNTLRGFSMTDSGLTATFLDPGADSRISDASTFGAPAGWATHSFLPAVFSSNHQIINFSAALNGWSIEGGDLGSEDDLVHARAWTGLNATGSIVASDDVAYDASRSLPDFITTVLASGTGFLSVELWEDGQSGQNDFYFDNMVARPIPEPATLVALTVGLTAALRRRRRA